jgi:hypothetical protein
MVNGTSEIKNYLKRKVNVFNIMSSKSKNQILFEIYYAKHWKNYKDYKKRNKYLHICSPVDGSRIIQCYSNDQNEDVEWTESDHNLVVNLLSDYKTKEECLQWYNSDPSKDKQSRHYYYLLIDYYYDNKHLSLLL